MSATAIGITENGMALLKKRYLHNGESVDSLWDRVSGGNEKFRKLLSELRFLPNSPTLFSAGLNNGCTLSACFVLGVADSMFGSRSITDVRNKAIGIAKAGGGVGYYFGDLRPKGSLINSIHRKACGPVVVLKDYHAISKLITQGGKRELAQMGVLPAWHPDIREFIHCKDEDPQGIGSFNISVSWTDEMLTRAHMVEKSVESELWREQCESAWRTGCPGMLFWDTMNTKKGNPNPHLGMIDATNPCQPGFATVLTKDGIRTFDDIEVGSTIWSGDSWTKVVRKIATGVKKVLRYVTTAGCFIGTEDHKVYSHGQKVRAGDADTIDTAVGMSEMVGGVGEDKQDVVDGWMIGDGLVHKASSNLVILCLGRNDGCFHEVLKEYVIKHRPGIREDMWVVRTTITADELPRTWNRQIPDRFRFGSREKVCGFLRGLYSANGSVCGNRVTLKSVSIQLIRQVQEMLSSIGIRSYYTTNKSKEVVWSNGTFCGKESYDLNIGPDRKRFQRLIGFIHLKKVLRLQEICKVENSVRGGKSSFEVMSVEEIGEMPVYDITVDDPKHTYWTGGVLVSNCGETGNRGSGEPCNLGSLNLIKYFQPYNRGVDIDRLAEDAAIATEFLDYILDINVFPHPDITEAALLTRKLGLGVMGWADLLALMHIHYDTEEAVRLGDLVMSTIQQSAHERSKEMAIHKGPYPGYSDKTFGDCKRNETSTSVAPTGTISILAGETSPSIEPHYALEWDRTTAEGMKLKQRIAVWDRLEGFVPKIASEISPEWHVRHQATFQKYTDLGVSKTINVDNSATVEDVSKAYKLMHSLGCKGGTLFRDGCRDEQVLVSTHKTKSVYSLPQPASDTNGITLETKVDSQEDVVFNRVEKIVSGNGHVASPPVHTSYKLPATRSGLTHKFIIGGVKGYITANGYADGRLAEIFLRVSKQGSTIAGLLDTWAMCFSNALQSGKPLTELIKLHAGSRFEPSGLTGDPDLPVCSSIPDYVVRWLERHFIKVSPPVSAVEFLSTMSSPLPSQQEYEETSYGDSGLFCPDCGRSLIYTSGCLSCSEKSCGWSRCG